MVIKSNSMNDLITDYKALTGRNNYRTYEMLKGRIILSELTNQILRTFGLFCAQNGFSNALPSEPKIVSLYLTHLSTHIRKISTLKRRLASISILHKTKGHYIRYKTSHNYGKFNGN